MTIYYVLLFSSALIFSLQFLITRQYQRYKGDTLQSSVKLLLGAYFFIALMFFVKNAITVGKIDFAFSWLTLIITLGQAIVAFLCLYLSIKILAVGDMSLYSMFMMIGSLVLPALTGFIMGEKVDDRKIIGIVLMFAALVLSVGNDKKKKVSLKAILYYIGIFIFNGMVGVLLTIHHKNPALTAGAFIENGQWTVNGDMYMVWYGLSMVITCILILAYFYVKPLLSHDKNTLIAATVNSNETVTKISTKIFVFLIPLLYGLFNGLGDYFITLATLPGALGSSVTFPIINGGTIIFSTIIGFFGYKEKPDLKIIISIVIVLCATLLFMFSTP